jgi:excisionase family DNA binding protein
MSRNAETIGSDSNRTSSDRFLEIPGNAESPANIALVQPLLRKDVQLLTVVEVGEFLGIGRSKVYELLYKGELKSVKIGGSRRIRYSDLGKYVRYLDDAS